MHFSIGTRQHNSTKSIIIVSIGFLLIGILAIIFVATDLAKSANWVETKATIVNIVSLGNENSSHDVYVNFTFGGKQYYNQLLNAYESTMYIGKEVLIRCDPNIPTRFMYGESTFFIVLLVAGGVFALIGLIIPAVTLPKRFKAKKLVNKDENKLDNEPKIFNQEENK